MAITNENSERSFLHELVTEVINQRDFLLVAINEYSSESPERCKAVQSVSPRYKDLPDMWGYAIKQASEIGQLSVLAPLIENLQKAHKNFIDISDKCANTSGQLANALENHCEATNRLINYLPAIESASLIARTTSITPAEIGRNTTPAKPGMFKRISGWIFKKTWHVIVAIIVAIIGSLIAAILLDIFGDFGWLERIKAFIYNILQL